jgi:hypothetical protein
VDGVLAEVAVWPDTDEIDNTPDYSQQLGPEAQRSIQLWAERRDGSDEDLLAAISAFDGGSSTETPAAAEDTDMAETAAAETAAQDAVMTEAEAVETVASPGQTQAVPPSEQAVTTPGADSSRQGEQS